MHDFFDRSVLSQACRLPLRMVPAVTDEVLLGLGDGVTRIQRKQCCAYQRLRNFACGCSP